VFGFWQRKKEQRTLTDSGRISGEASVEILS
jgi:hypothetical protein